VEFMGGALQVESQLGLGSKFIVTLPYRYDEQSYRLAMADASTAPPLHCLLVTNNQALDKVLVDYLATWSLQTEIYTDATGGNASLLRRLYDLVTRTKVAPCLLLDQQSSKVEPITLARSLRADPLLANTYFLLITHNQRPIFHQELLNAGVDGVILQPVTQSAIYNLLAKQLQTQLAPLRGDEESAPTLKANQPKVDNLVLVVEDYVNNQRVALAHLKKLGYAAHVVENGQAAVEAVTQSDNRYQLVLMDWQMPVMDGLEATQSIRQAELQSQHHIPIIGMTANAIKGDRERCLEAGMDDYISKPIRREELQRVLSAWAPTT